MVVARHARQQQPARAVRRSSRCAVSPLFIAALFAFAAPALRRRAARRAQAIVHARRQAGAALTSSAISATPISAIPIPARGDDRRRGGDRFQPLRLSDRAPRRRGGQSRAGRWPTARTARRKPAIAIVGATRSGLIVVVAYYSGGGTGVFHTLHVLDASLAAGLDGDGKRHRARRSHGPAQRRPRRPLGRRRSRSPAIRSVSQPTKTAAEAVPRDDRGEAAIGARAGPSGRSARDRRGAEPRARSRRRSARGGGLGGGAREETLFLRRANAVGVPVEARPRPLADPGGSPVAALTLRRSVACQNRDSDLINRLINWVWHGRSRQSLHPPPSAKAAARRRGWR